MDEKTKAKVIEVKKLIASKEYDKALEVCDYITIMLTSKQPAVYLFAGFCQEKLKKDAEAEKSYKFAEDLDPNNIDCCKALYGLYTRLKKPDQAAIYLKRLCQQYKKTDKLKFREHFIKLIKHYESTDELETIYKMLLDMIQNEKELSPELVSLASAYFKLSTEDRSFDMKIIGNVGEGKQLIPEAKEGLDILLCQTIKYLYAVADDYGMNSEQICDTILYLRNCFPDSSAILYLLLKNDYAVTHVEMVENMMTEIYYLMAAYYDPESEAGQNRYKNSQYIHPWIFVLSMIGSFQYLSFFVEFFGLAPAIKTYYGKLSTEQEKLRKQLTNQEDKEYLESFVLTDALKLSRNIDSPQTYKNLQSFRERAKKYQGFVEEIVARLAMKVFKDYKQLNDMKNVLKVRIAKEPGNTFLLKFYFDYLMRISRTYKVFDEQIDVEEILEKVVQLDPQDVQYRSERLWIKFSKYVTQNEPIEKLREMQLEMESLSKSDKSTEAERANLMKKATIMAIHCNINQNLFEKLQQILNLNPKCYQTLICLGSERYQTGHIQQALSYFKRAFIVYQRDYHLNRYVYLCLMKLGLTKEAQNFVRKIYPAFKNVFWLNHVLAIISMNEKQHTLAENYLNKAIEALFLNRGRQYSISYEKIQERPDLSTPFLIKQNKYSIFDQYLTIPEHVIFRDLPWISNYYWKEDWNNQKLTEIRMWIQMAQILKIEGRLSSAYKSIRDAENLADESGYTDLCQTEAVTNDNCYIFELILQLQKELATILYYYLNIKQANNTIDRALELNHKLIEFDSKYEETTSQLLALKFQIAVEKLTTIIRFETYETTDNFIKNMVVPECRKPTIPYAKSMYQFKLRCYLHNRNATDGCLESIDQFLRMFGLDYQKIETKQFSDTYYGLRLEDRKQVVQAIEDLAVFMYLKEGSVSKKHLLRMLELFHESSLLYILYGTMEADPVLKTGAFLKCIQLDKQSSVAIEYLAYLYLKNRNVVAAAKLYLKSVELNPLNLKAYIELTILLFTLAIRDSSLVGPILSKVNAYLNYLKVTNPSIEYNLVEFLQLLVYEDVNMSDFQKKIRVDSGIRAYSHLKKSNKIMECQLMDRVMSTIKVDRMWAVGQVHLQDIAKRAQTKETDVSNIVNALLSSILQKLGVISRELPSFKKLLEGLYSQVMVVIDMSEQVKLQASTFNRLIQSIESMHRLAPDLLSILKKDKLKTLKYRLLQRCSEDGLRQKIHDILHYVETPEYDLQEAHKKGQRSLKSCVSRLLLKNPQGEEARKHLTTILAVRSRRYLPGQKEEGKAKMLNDSMQDAKSRLPALTKLVMTSCSASDWMMLLYERFKDPNNRTQKNIKYWLRVLLSDTVCSSVLQKSKKNDVLRSNLISMIAEMYAELQKRYGKWEVIQEKMSKLGNLKERFEQIGVVRQLLQKPTLDSFKRVRKMVDSQSLPLICIKTLNVLVTRIPPSTKMDDLLQKIVSQSNTTQLKTYAQLLAYINSLRAQNIPSKIDSSDAIIMLNRCTPQQPTSISLRFCQINTCLFRRDFEGMDAQLNLMMNYILTNRHDTLLACLYDILLCYHNIGNVQKPEAFDVFREYVARTLERESNPQVDSFLHYLHAMAILYFGQTYGIGVQVAKRLLAKSTLLNPSKGRQIVSSFKK